MVMLESISLEEGLLLFVIIHLSIGISQFFYYPSIKNYVEKQIFPDKSYPVSVIVPVKGTTPTLEHNFRSLCSQDYPDYELIFVSEREDDPGVEVARRIQSEFLNDSLNPGAGSLPSHVHVVVAGELQDLRMIAKSHNMIEAVGHARGEVFLFTDSDVFHPQNWIREMINPLGETVRGRKISASTAVFFIDPEGFLGIFPSLSTNPAAFLASFTRKNQDLPTYASGASMAVFAHVFYSANVIDAWKRTLNDDLVMACTLVNNGFHIFNVRRLPTRPVEKFDSWRGMNNKMVRWILTVTHYTHPTFHREAYGQGIFNLQFQTLVNISLILALLNALDLLDVNWSFILKLLAITYSYNVFTRLLIAGIIKEKNVYPYVWLSPISQYFWGFYFILISLFFKEFTWGGRKYRMNKRFGKLIREG